MPNAGEKFVTNWGETTRLKSLHPRCRKIRRLESLVRRLFEKIVISFGWLEDSPYFFFFFSSNILSLFISPDQSSFQIFEDLILVVLAFNHSLNITRSLQIVNSWETSPLFYDEGRKNRRKDRDACWLENSRTATGEWYRWANRHHWATLPRRKRSSHERDGFHYSSKGPAFLARGVANFKAFLAKNGEIFLKKKTIFIFVQFNKKFLETWLIFFSIRI